MDFWPVLLNRMPGWFFSAAAIVVLAGVGLVLWELGRGAKLFSQAIGRENLLLRLQEQLSAEREAARRNSAVASRLTTVLCNTREYTEVLNRLSSPQTPNPSGAAGNLVQRVLEGLSRDVKQEPGGLHRCGLWVGQDGQLVLSFGSSGFPPHYLNGGRRLDINRSVAGRALRHNESMRKDDASKDDIGTPVRSGPPIQGVDLHPREIRG